MSKLRIFSVILVLTFLFSNFVVPASAAATFSKISPANGATNIPASSVTLSWSKVEGYTGTDTITYRYCILAKKICPRSKWVRVGTATSVTIYNLTPNKTYNWWVRAYNSQNQIIAEANADASGVGQPWSFTTLALPGAFNKISPPSPANGSTDRPTSGVQLAWSNSTNPAPDHYEYCLDTVNNNRCDSGWINVGSSTIYTLPTLSVNTVFYWQVQAVNGSGATQADRGTWWSFTTTLNPSIFGKIWPLDNSTGQPAVNLGLSWMISQNAASYTYCINTAASCPSDTSWVNIGNATSATVTTVLNYSTSYYWQVRAYNNLGVQINEGNNGVWWRFTTKGAPPADFNKLSPGDTATMVYTDVNFTWGPSTGALYYEFCLSDTGVDLTCGDSPWLRITGTSYTAYDLAIATNYSWQVRAVNDGGDTTDSNTGTWWSFTTQPDPPSAFDKTSPADGASVTNNNLTLAWNPTASSGASYQVCYDTTPDAACDQNAWSTPTSGTSYTLPTLAEKTTYYWQVRATTVGGTTYANGDMAAWWSFTTRPTPPSSSDKTVDLLEDHILNDTLQGADTQNWVFQLYGSAPAGITFALQPSGHFTYQPPQNYDGPVPITFQFKVSDGINTPVGPYTVTINVLPVNDPPVLDLITVPATILSSQTIKFTALASDVDLPADKHLTFSGTNLPANATLDQITGTFSWTTNWIKGGNNTYTFTITVKDDGGLTDSQTITVTVMPQIMNLPIILR